MSRRARVITVAFAALAALAVAWIGTSWLQRAQVDVAWAGELHCTGSEISSVHVESGGRVPAMAMRSSMNCRRTARVTNHGWLTVKVDKVTLPLMGPGAGGGVQVPTLEGEPADAVDDPVDAIFDLDRSVEAGSSEEFEVEFRFRPDGCDSDGGSMWLNGLPQVRISALWLSGNRENPEYTAFRGTAESSCDS